ncbi:uncharacterized protein [Diadema setosum]|uniref:uncharacterized protein n=1 Tax=Diadema setosum TaxID=31175 RepID=UPI003B3B0E87
MFVSDSFRAICWRRLFILAFFAIVFFRSTAGISERLAAAVERELQDHVRRIELRADEMYAQHRRSVDKIREEHARMRHRRSSTYHIQDLRHGFVPGSGVGNREAFSISGFEIVGEFLSVAGDMTSFAIGQKTFLVYNVKAQDTDYVAIVQFVTTPNISMIPVHVQQIHAQSMAAFTQGYSLAAAEKKVILVSEEETVILVANTDGTAFEQTIITVHPTDVTNVEYFSIGLDSYLVFSRDAGDPIGEKSPIYLWSATGKKFNLRQRVQTYGAQKVQTFEITGRYYILMVNKNNASTIWQYNTRQAQFVTFQRLMPDGAVDAVFFSQGYESFLVFTRADRQSSTLFHWDGFHFHESQTLPTPNAISWSLAVEPNTCQDVPLVVLSSRLPWQQSISVFSVENAELVGGYMSGLDHARYAGLNARLTGATRTFPFSDWAGQMYMVIQMEGGPPPDGRPRTLLLELDQEIQPVPSPYGQQVQTAFQAAFEVVEKRLEEYEKKVVDATDELRDAISLKDGKLEIEGGITFNGSIIFNGTVEVERVDADDVIADNSVEDGRKLGDVLDELERKATENQRDVAALRTLFDDRVSLSGADTITGHKIFRSLTVVGELSANTLSASSVNGVDVVTLDSTTLKNNVPGQTLAGKLTFNDDTTTTNVVLPEGVLVNGFDMGEAVTETGAQTISGAKTFSQAVTISSDAVFQADVTLDTVDVSEEVVTLSGTHQLDQSITFSDALTINGNIVTTSTVDGVDVSDLDADTVREAGAKTVTGPVTFSSPVTVTGDVAISGTANTIDLADFDSRAVRHNVDTTITGAKIFSADVTVEGDLHSSGTIDGVKVFSDTLLINSTESNRNPTESHISGLLFPYGEGLDTFLPSNDDETANATALEQEFPFFGTTQTSLYVNTNGLISFGEAITTYTPVQFHQGIDQSYIAPFWSDVNTNIAGTVSYRQKTRTSREDPIFQEADRIVCKTLQLHFDSTWLLIATWHEVAYFGATGPARNTFQVVLVTDGTLSFAIFNYEDINWTTGSASDGSAETGLGGTPAMAGYNAGDGEIYYKIPGSWTGDIVDIDDGTNTDTVGRWLLEVDHVKDTSMYFKGQLITGHKRFTNCLRVARALQVEGLVDGIDIDEGVMLSASCTIGADKMFEDGITVEGDIHTSGEVDGVDVSDLAPKVMTLDTRQSVQGDITFSNPLTSNRNVNVQGNVNGKDLSVFEADAVYKNENTEQVITAAKTFTDSVSVSTGHITFSGSVNTYDLSSDFLDLSTAQTVSGAKTFTDGFQASAHMDVGGTVDGVTIQTLWSSAALTTRDETLGGDKTFTGSASVGAALGIGGDTNTVDLSEDIVMLSGEQTITGAKVFTCVTATGDVAVTGNIGTTTLNGQTWTDFVNDRVTLSTDQTVTGGVTFSDQLSVTGNIENEDETNEVDLPLLASRILYITGDQTVTGAKTFTGTTTVSGTATLDGSLDGVNIDPMKTNAIYLNDGTQTITQIKTFKSDLSVQNDLSISGLLSLVDLEELNDDIVWTNDGPQTITGTKEFEDGFTVTQSVVVSGEVNDIDISEEVLVVIDAQDITGAYSFYDDVTINGELNVDGEINDVDIAALSSDTMRKDRVQTVSSHLEFNDGVSVTGDITVRDGETVDTVDLSALKDLAKFVDEPFTLPNSVTFELPLTFSGTLSVTGTVHDLDFQAWAATVLRKDTTQTITGAHKVVGTMQGDVDVSVLGNIAADSAYTTDLSDFFTDAVRLQGNRVITGEKTFTGNVAVEGNVAVTGLVDGVDIAGNLVTRSGAQTITGAKTFDTCDVQTNANILLTGSVNDVEISEAHADTLFFDSPSKMTGKKTFSRDTTINGDLQVDGLVDGKDIDEGFTLDTEQTVTAYHIFNNEATVTGSITVGGLVETVDLAEIDSKRVTLSGSNTVTGSLTFNDMATFEADVTTAYLFDGVDLSELAAEEASRHIGYEDQIYGLACFAETQCERTEAIAEVVNNFLDAIDYVEEEQVIQKHIQKFETFSMDGTTYLAAAIYADDHRDVCTTSVIYRWSTETSQFEELERLNTNGAVAWKHFVLGGEDYLIVANSGHVPCHDTSSSNAIYKFVDGSFTLVGSAGEAMDATSDIDAFTVGEKDCLVFTTYDGSIATIYVYNDGTGDFEVMQDLSTGVTSSVESIQIEDKTFLVFSLYLLEISKVYIYDEDNEEFVFHQEIESEHAREVTGYHYDNTHGFALADHISVTDVDATFEVQVRVFTWNAVDETFHLTFTVPVVQPGDVDIFSEGNFLYLCVVQEYHSVDFFRLEGSAGFIKFYTIPHHGVKSVEFFRLQESEYEAAADIEYDQLMMAVAVDPFPKHDVFSRILKVVNIGGSVRINTEDDMCESGLREAMRSNVPEPTCE